MLQGFLCGCGLFEVTVPACAWRDLETARQISDAVGKYLLVFKPRTFRKKYVILYILSKCIKVNIFREFNILEMLL